MPKYSRATLSAMRELVCDMSEDEITTAVTARIKKYGNLSHDNIPVDETEKLFHSMVAERAMLRRREELLKMEAAMIAKKEAEIEKYHSCW